MRVLVTGHAGFIGFHTAKRLLERGDSVVGFDNVNDYYDPALKRARLGVLDRVAAEDGDLHVSLDADFLDPRLAPAVGTAVPGGATLEEAGRIAALLGESGRVTSLDLVELNPRLAAARRTAALLIALAADILPPCPEALRHTGS